MTIIMIEQGLLDSLFLKGRLPCCSTPERMIFIPAQGIFFGPSLFFYPFLEDDSGNWCGRFPSRFSSSVAGPRFFRPPPGPVLRFFFWLVWYRLFPSVSWMAQLRYVTLVFLSGHNFPFVFLQEFFSSAKVTLFFFDSLTARWLFTLRARW